MTRRISQSCSCNSTNQLSPRQPVGERTGFTIVELLVTIAVIAVLIGILAPALSSARTSGRMVVCASNVRQIQLANQMYAYDHQDRFAPGASEITITNKYRWHGERSTSGPAFDPELGALTPYLDGKGSSKRVRACPSFVHTLEDLHERGMGFENGCGGYGYNNAFVGTERVMNAQGKWVIDSDKIGSKQSRFAAPSLTVAFADSAIAQSELIEYSFIEPPKWPQFPRHRPDPSIHFRHAGNANAAWLDGHVGPEERSFTYSSGIYTADPDPLGIGWFGPVEDNRLFDYE